MEFRSFTPELEVRARGGKRLLCGIVLPYGVEQQVGDRFVERFERGAFAHQFRAANRVQLLNQHSNQAGFLMLGYAATLRDDTKGLYGEYRVVEGPMGDHFLSLVREGVLRQWSAGFTPIKDRMDGRIVVRVKADLFETALVTEGQYGELAAVGQMRAAIPVLTRDTLLARMPKPLFPA